jgi:hypothetical protein
MVGYLISFTAVKKKELVLRLAIERVVVWHFECPGRPWTQLQVR